jgi:hypothetical protein
MRRITIALLWMVLLGCPVAGARAQSLYGPGGLFLNPTADVPPKGQLTPALLVLPQRIPSTPGLHEFPTWVSGSLDYGVANDVEIGFTSLAITDFETSYGGSFKYRFLHESANRPAMAAGFAITGFGGSDTQEGFVALRKQLNKGERHPIIGHVGLQYISMSAGLDYHQFLPYGGVEYGLARRFTLIGEVRPRGRGDFKTSTALSLSYQYGRGGRVVLTWANTGQSTQPMFGFGVGYGIGGRR